MSLTNFVDKAPDSLDTAGYFVYFEFQLISENHTFIQKIICCYLFQIIHMQY